MIPLADRLRQAITHGRSELDAAQGTGCSDIPIPAEMLQVLLASAQRELGRLQAEEKRDAPI